MLMVMLLMVLMPANSHDTDGHDMMLLDMMLMVMMLMQLGRGGVTMMGRSSSRKLGREEKNATCQTFRSASQPLGPWGLCRLAQPQHQQQTVQIIR